MIDPMANRAAIGALLAFERRTYAMTVFMKATVATDAWILIPVGCIAESWQDGSKQALLARLMKLANELPDVDVARAKRAGLRSSLQPTLK